jgi:hypothetical protein
MKPVEARLREALEDRASQVTEDTLVRHHADPTRVVVPLAARRDNRRNRLLVLAAAAVAFILAGVSWIVIANRQGVPANPPVTVTSAAPAPSSAESTDATSTPEPSASATPTATPTSHVPGDYPRSAIPWSEVGSGWSYVGVVGGQNATSSAVALVSPWGARYSVGTYEASLVDASSDGRTVLLGAFNAVWVIDVTTGTKHTISAPNGGSGIAALTRPSGQAVLMVDLGAGTPNRLRKINAQTASTQFSVNTDVERVQSSPDGKYIVGHRSSNPTGSVLILGNATGTVLATVPTPTGTTFCSPQNWWSNDELVVSCFVGTNADDLWRYSLTTHAMTRVTRGTKAKFGYVLAYPSSAGTVVQQGGSCGPGPIGILSSDGTTDTALKNIPNAGGTAAALVGVVGTTAFLVFGGCGDATTPARSYVAYDLVSGTPVTLVPGTSGGVGVGFARVLT